MQYGGIFQNVLNIDRTPTPDTGFTSITPKLDGVDLSFQIANSAIGLPSAPFNATPTGTAATGRVLVANNSSGSVLRWSNLPGTASAGSGIKGIITSNFVSTTIQGGGNATYSPDTGLTFDSTTVPDTSKVYILSFANVGTLLLEFNGADVQFANNQWNIHPVDIELASGTTGVSTDFNSEHSIQRRCYECRCISRSYRFQRCWCYFRSNYR